MAKLPDNTGKYYNFEETNTTAPGKLPVIPVTNLKNVLLDWLTYKFKALNLKNPLVILGEYPSQTMIANLPTGNTGTMAATNVRGISVVLLDGRTTRQGIGQVLEGENVIENGQEKLRYGWHESIQMEISFWSTSTRDRDYGGDLTRAYILEAFRSGYLLSHGVIDMGLRNYYDTSDNKLESNNKYISFSVSVFDINRQFWGTLDYSKLEQFPTIAGVDITTNLDQQSTDIPSFGNFVPNAGESMDFIPATEGTFAKFDNPTDNGVIICGSTVSPIANASTESAHGFCTGG